MEVTNLEKWRGRRDEVKLDPTVIQFRSQPRRSCKGCMFESQWAEVCESANREAVKRQMPACETGVVYVAVEVDPRQLKIEEQDMQ